MTLDAEWQAAFSSDVWFQNNRVAWEIVSAQNAEISSTSTAAENLRSLLENMFQYGRDNWRYEPGTAVRPAATLAGDESFGNWNVTDCKSLAQMFVMIAQRLGYATAATHKIEREGHRIVTRQNMTAINGATGSPAIENRWCFGDHWIAVYEGMCYDPTFNLHGFTPDEIDVTYLGWYAREVADPSVFCLTRWEGSNPDERTIYLSLDLDYSYESSPNTGALRSERSSSRCCCIIL